MKNFVIIISICLAYFTACCSCKHENCHKKIIIINNSNKSIYYHPNSSNSDTLILDYNPTSIDGFKIEKLSSKNDYYNSCIEGRFYDSKTIRYIFYDAQILETTPWDTVRAKYLILKRYDLSLEDLQRMNWTITYP